MLTRTLVLLASAAGLLLGLSLAGCDPQQAPDTPAEADAPPASSPTGNPAFPGSDKPAFTGLPDDPEKTPPPAPQMTLPSVRDVVLTPQPVNGPEQAQQALEDAQAQIGLGDGSQLALTGQSDDGYGTTYYHSQQTYRGLRVIGATANLEVREGRAETLSGTWVKDIDLEIDPRHTALEAFRKSLADRGVPPEREVDLLGASELLVFISQQRAHLAWRLQARFRAPTTLPRLYVVDAHDPAILHEQPVFEP